MPPFSRDREEFLPNGAYRELQARLLENPESGVVMSDCGGLRKIRWYDTSRGKGKRSGCRVIYLYHPEVQRLDLMLVYDKDTQDDLTAAQKKRLRELAEVAKVEARKRGQRATRRKK
ncbi:MAG: toxin [Candidatus Hydrogenedens sp.]|nr:toxin [Candidatus Hydrogenedens sp.]